MNKVTPTCPACGSKAMTRHENVKSDHITLGSNFDYKQIYYTCKSCHEEIDIFCETDQNFEAAQKKAQHLFIQHSIEWLNQNKVSMATFERVFELPQRTLTRWKEGNFSSSTLSFLRIITTFPWIIKIAENRFDSTSVTKELIFAATNKFLQCSANSMPDQPLTIEVKSGNTIFARVNYHTQATKPTIAINGQITP